MASSINNAAWLEWMATLMGGVSRQAYAATFPPDRFYCLLDELPLHLIPRALLRGLQRSREEIGQVLVLNPECVLCSGEELPGELANQRELCSRFALQGTIAWVQDRKRSMWLPFWLGPRLEETVRSLQPSESVPESLSPDVVRLLLSAGILIAEQDYHSEKDGFTQPSTQFREKGYAPVGGLIHPFHVAALRRYYRYLIRTGSIQLGDKQSSRRYIAHNEPVARFFHQQIAVTLSWLAGEPLKPSYVYQAAYLSGAELRKHIDREQCEFSLTLCLDFSPEPELATPWPIRLDTRSGTVTVYQALGDALAYRGTRLPHYRDRLGEGQTSTSIFFHYVPENFAGTLD